MAPRPDTSEEDTALPTRPTTKMEKGQAKGRVQHESEPESDAEDNEQGGSPKGAKRARANENGDAVRREDGQQGEAEEDAPTKKRVKTLPRDVDGFIPGSILRIQLRNFVTYDAVSFRPGPFLNMILGPNGTGKSSIACAICLGLNWPPKILGRATDLPSFVKIGADTGFIEIELKSPPGQPNLVIRRNLSATSRSSTFTLNGKPATGAEINDKVAKLNVQVGNLCSFLPQDKVSAFAAMSPVELLRETENAAGDEKLNEWHKTLIESGGDLKKLTETIQSETATMRQLQERNDNIERDVQRYRERKKIERTITLLRVLIPVQHYREARSEFIRLKARQRAQHHKVSRLQERNQPAHAMLLKLEKQYIDVHGERESAKKTLRAALQRVEKKTTASEALEGESDNIQNALVNLKKNEKIRLAKIKNSEAEIASLKEQLAKEVKVESEADVRADRARAQAEISATPLETERHAVEQKEDALKQKRNRNQQNESYGRNQLKELESVDGIKLRDLSRWDRDAADAVVWLRNHKDQFKMEVFEPPALSVSVPDQTFARAVENSFNQAQMKMFVCQCKEDYDTLNRLINDTQGLGRKARVPTWFRPGTEDDLVEPPMSPDELKDRGFDGYAIDYVECPEGMRWFLKRELNMHRTAISRRGIRDLQGAIDAVGRPGPGGRTSNTTFVDRETVHQVQRSKYGQRNLMSSSTQLGAVRNFGGKQVNPADKARIDEILQRCKQEAAEIHDAEREIGTERKRIEAADKKNRLTMREFDDRLTVIKDAVKQKEAIRRKLTNAETTLATNLNKGNAAQEGAKLRGQIMDIAKKRVKLVSEAVELSREVITEQQRATTLGLQYLQIGAKKTALKELCDRKDAKYQTALAEFNKIDAEFEALKTTTRELLDQSKVLLSELPDDMREEYQETEQARLQHEKACADAEKKGQDPPEPAENVDMRSMEELQTELEKQEANLEMNMNTNPGVVEQYEKRKEDIAVLAKTIEGRQRQANKIEKGIKVARDNWEPALQSLVTSIGKKFSAAFDRIGCAGEIRVRQEESYDQWAIDILVKFRDTEKLQLLTGQRQSGGERSLTTILYLMSLTEEARAPFSLVDEINQGMDQRAERMVHNSMVEVTCKSDSAQYFLITPKLLPDLEYHERMKILCVNNGEWLPDDSGLGNMMSMIDGYVSKNPRA
ncbi:P-loop containing nucleoside triphosphate hydrolase protein [Mycena filopes]|nr:P-loop containing nucleoside triphosphate hydrolase protein [Mycena filopes]